LVLPLLGLGKVWEGENTVETAQVLEKHQLQPLKLQAKEGLALINGTQFILAHAILGLDKFRYLLDLADVAAAFSIEAYQGSASPFKKELHEIRAYKGSQLVAKRMTKLLKNSENLEYHENCGRVQDPYSMRCVPQVHGASRNAYEHLKEMAETELNSVTDNPIVISDEEAISGGNFHGQLMALPIDYATLAAAELTGSKIDYPEWYVKVLVPYDLVGGKYNNGRRVRPGEILKRKTWYQGSGVENQEYFTHFIYDPSYIYGWILNQLSAAQMPEGFTKSTKTSKEGRVINGLSFDATGIKTPTEPIFKERAYPSIFAH
jgi:hypothetical protein